MAIAFDSGNKGVSPGSTSLTISQTCSGSDRVLLVFASCLNSTNHLASATVTYNGVSMGSPIVTPHADAASNFLYAWILVAPDTGTHDVVITPSAGAYLDAYAASFTGVDQSTPSDGSAKVGNLYVGSPVSTSITTSAGGFAVDMLCRRVSGSSLTPDGSQTRISTELVAAISTSGASYKSGATAMVWTHAGTENAAHAVVALKAAAGGGGGSSAGAAAHYYRQLA